MTARQSFYDERAQGYAPPDRDVRIRLRKTIRLAALTDGARVLDVGAKFGELKDAIDAEGIDVDYTGVELVDRVAEIGRQAGRRIVTGDLIAGLPEGELDGQFDATFCLEILEHVESPSALLRAIHAVLADDGALILSVPNPYYWAERLDNLLGRPDTEGHIHAFTPAILARLLDFTGFTLERRKGTTMRVPLIGRLIGHGRDTFPCNLGARSILARCRKKPAAPPNNNATQSP